jgi:transposase
MTAEVTLDSMTTDVMSHFMVLGVSPQTRIAQLERQVAARDARIAQLEGQVAVRDARIARLVAQVEALTRRGAELEARLGQDSTNTSRPPASDPPRTKRTGKPPKGQRPGGQPGHEYHERQLLPPERVNRVIKVEPPKQCKQCRRRLKGAKQEAVRHQQIEVPALQPVVTEYQCEARVCEHCGTLNRAQLPAQVAGQVFGERLSAVVCLLVGKYRLSTRLVQQALSDVLGVSLSLGAVSNREREMSEALSGPVAEAEQYLREQERVHMDETGWVQGHEGGRGRRVWLWVMASSLVAVFRIALSRGSEVAKSLLGKDFVGILTTDRWGAYNWYDTDLRQLCWSHLTRDIQGWIDRGGEGARIGRELMHERNRMFKWWHRVRDGTLSRQEFERKMRPVRREVGRLLREAAVCAEKKTAGMAREILKLEQAMWTFVDVEGVEPTNNFGERIIRYAVIYRKTSFGTQSPEGSRFIERILTAVVTLSLQRRNVLDYLTELLGAHRRGLSAPSLVPAMTTTQANKAA